MTRAVFLACRGLFTLVCLVTSLYCLLAFLPFTYQNVIEFKVVGWTGAFALLHPWIWWIALVAAAWTMTEDYRPGTRALVVGFLIAGAASGIALVVSPLLAGIQNEFRSLVWAGVWLAPLWWVAVIDFMGPGSRLRWNGRDEQDGARVFWTCVATGVTVPLLYAGIHGIRTRGEAWLPAIEANTAEITNTMTLWRAASMPTTSAPISELCSARSARPAGDSIKLSASHTATSSNAPTTQYQMRSPCSTRSPMRNGTTAIPSGPPVNLSSVVMTMKMMTPRPSVAMAR